MNPINFYPIKYFVEISQADLTGTINLIDLEPLNPEPKRKKSDGRSQKSEGKSQLFVVTDVVFYYENNSFFGHYRA